MQVPIEMTVPRRMKSPPMIMMSITKWFIMEMYGGSRIPSVVGSVGSGGEGGVEVRVLTFNDSAFKSVRVAGWRASQNWI